MNKASSKPKQLLSKETYFDPEWFEQEKKDLFDQSWVFVCLETELSKIGDYFCLQFMQHSLLVVRDKQDDLRAFHNICRHRGCEVLEGKGNTGASIICPYHRWTYSLDGSLRGITNEAECFDAPDKGKLALHSASVGIYRGLVFVNPSEAPQDSFKTFIGNLDDFAWPHDFTDGSLRYEGEVTYDMQCNWKLFYENAIDGYHLAYLHDQTLGKLYPSKNLWKTLGRNHLWYSTERQGEPQTTTILTEQFAAQAGSKRLSTDTPYYPGVIMLFPLTIISPNPWGFTISSLEPVGPERTLMKTRSWAPHTVLDWLSPVDHKSSTIRLSDLKEHPKESGDFQIEDMWIVEKIQRTIHSPKFSVGPLANGAGAESPLMQFQQNVLDFVGKK